MTTFKNPPNYLCIGVKELFRYFYILTINYTYICVERNNLSHGLSQFAAPSRQAMDSDTI